VADASTSRLMQEFYRIRETKAGITKLEALREAQLELLHGDVQIDSVTERDRGVVLNRESPGTASFPNSAKAPYAHPYYWAPFFLMGNWL
jgi:CHAT domain-containing protein